MKRSCIVVVALALLALLAVVAISMWRGSTDAWPDRDPTGEVFPTVSGESLEKEPVKIPDDFLGEPAVLIVGYQQRAQFDIDRWLMGLLQTGEEMPIVEVPTIPGLVPTMISGWIDDGMRSGIPREDWGAVVTLYGDAARPVAELTGTERGQVARVIVLAEDGTIAWFDDEGYSARKALEVAQVVSGLRR